MSNREQEKSAEQAISQKLEQLFDRQKFTSFEGFSKWINKIRKQIFEDKKRPDEPNKELGADADFYIKTFRQLFGDPAQKSINPDTRKDESEPVGTLRKKWAETYRKVDAYYDQLIEKLKSNNIELNFNDGGAKIGEVINKIKKILDERGNLDTTTQIILSILAARLIADAVKNWPERQSFEETTVGKLGVWTQFSIYKISKETEDFDEDTFFVKAGKELGRDLPDGGQWRSADVIKTLFPLAYGINQKLGQLLDENQQNLNDQEFEDLKQQMALLKESCAVGETGVSETIVLYNRLKAKYDLFVDRLHSNLSRDLILEASTKLTLAGKKKEFLAYAAAINGLLVKIEELEVQDSSALLDEDQKFLKNNLEVVEREASFADGKYKDELGETTQDILSTIHRKVVLKTKVLLRSLLDEPDEVFTPDVRDWMMGVFSGESLQYSWQQVQYYWNLYGNNPNNGVLFTFYDKRILEGLAKDFKEGLQDLMDEKNSFESNNFRPDVSHKNRETAIKIQLNRIAEMLRAVERNKANSESVGKAGEEIEVATPTEGTAISWRKAFEDALRGKSESEILGFLKEQRANMEMMETSHTNESTAFSLLEKGKEFSGLISYLEVLIETNPKFKYLHSYFKNRLAIMDKMNPNADSDAGTADFLASLESQPTNIDYKKGKVTRFFLGTNGVDIQEPEKHYEYYKEVRETLFIMEDLRTQQYDFFTEESKSKDISLPGYFSFGKANWMGTQGGYYGKFTKRIKKEFDDKNIKLSPEKMDEVIRIAFSIMVLNGGFAELFVNGVYGVGKSPPAFLELEFITDIYPQAKYLNAAKEDVSAIPEVVHGEIISKRWLLKQFTKTGIYAFIVKNNNFNKPSGYQKNKLWGQANAPDVREIDKFDDYLNGLSEEQAWKILEIIKDSKYNKADNGDFNRARNILRSIEISEKLSKLFHVHDRRPQRLVDIRGNLDPKGDYILPKIISPRYLMFGATELKDGEAGHFADEGSNYGLYEKSFNALEKIKELIDSLPPDLERGYDHHHDAIQTILDHFEKIRKTSSSPKQGLEFIDWQAVVYEYSLGIYKLFAAYRKAGFGDPTKKPSYSITTQRLKEIFRTNKVIRFSSLVAEMLEKLEESGQIGFESNPAWYSTRGFRDRDGNYVGMAEYFHQMLMPDELKNEDLDLYKQLHQGLYRISDFEKFKDYHDHSKVLSLAREYGVSIEEINNLFGKKGGKTKAEAAQEEEIKNSANSVQ
mgnify:CR=1 FL=1